MHRWYLLSSSPRQDCLSNGSNGQTIQDPVVQTPSALQASSSCASLLSPPSSSVAVKHGPCLLTLDPGFQTKCQRKLLPISALEPKTHSLVRSEIHFLVGPQEPLLVFVKRQNLAWFGHVMCHGSLFKTILQSTLEGGRYCGQQRKCWMDNIKEWTSRQNCSQGPPAEKTGRESLLGRLSCPPYDPIYQGTEMN